MEVISISKYRSAVSSENEEAIKSILSTANFIRKRREKILEPFGINPQKFEILQILYNEFPGVLSQLQIRERISEKTIDLPRVIDCMDRNCLLTQIRSTNNKRVAQIMITPKGVELIKTIGNSLDETDYITSHIAPQEMNQIIGIMHRLTDSLNQPSTQLSVHS